MSNTRKIQPKQIETTNGVKTATIFSLTDFHGYNFDNSHAYAILKFIGMESSGTSVDENGQQYSLPESAVEYYSEPIVIPATIISNWGTDDDIIFNYVANEFDLVIIP